jgi:signal transduction histidine kinase
MLSAIAKEHDFVSWQIVDGAGNIVLSDRPVTPALSAALSQARPSSADPLRVAVPEQRAEFWVIPLRMRTERNAWLFRLGYATESVRAQIRGIVFTNVLAGLSLAVLLAGVSLIAMRQLLRPLDAVTKAAARMGGGNLTVSLPAAGNDEIGELVRGFSAMVASIRERDLKITEHLQSLEEARLDLEARVDERTSELRRLNRRLVEASRQAGKAEMASEVLHNVGNILNSVNVSATMLGEKLAQRRFEALARVNGLLGEHSGDLGLFLTEDPRGKLVPEYLERLASTMRDEQQAAEVELTSLVRDIEHIKEIISMQQSYARVTVDVREAVPLGELMEDALRMAGLTGGARDIEVVREYTPEVRVVIDRHKTLQILVNLISNAKHAIAATAPQKGRIVLRARLENDDKMIRMEVADDGVGIPQENMVKIFQHGFTTKKEGHGFGLHGCALAAKQMGGTLTAASDGAGRGATFSLAMPSEATRPGGEPSSRADSVAAIAVGADGSGAAESSDHEAADAGVGREGANSRIGRAAQ